jgi:hypothetical protein
MKDFFKVVVSTLLFIFVSVAAFAVVGQKPIPGNGPGLTDGTWLDGLAGGSNYKFQYAITAVGTNQATAVQLPANIHLLEVDTAGSGGATGVALPTCLGGTEVVIDDNTAYTIDVYPNVANNPITAAQDTINNTTSTTITTYASKLFTCGQNGVWAAK